MPLAGSRVIPAAWSDHHRPTAESAMTGTCEILLPGPRETLDESAGEMFWGEFPCRVQQHNGQGADSIAAGQEVQQRQYLVALPVECGIDFITGTTGHVIHVLSGNDPFIVGRRLNVVQVLYGNETWQRDLLCRDVLTQNRVQ